MLTRRLAGGAGLQRESGCQRAELVLLEPVSHGDGRPEAGSRQPEEPTASPYTKQEGLPRGADRGDPAVAFAALLALPTA